MSSFNLFHSMRTPLSCLSPSKRLTTVQSYPCQHLRSPNTSMACLSKGSVTPCDGFACFTKARVAPAVGCVVDFFCWLDWPALALPFAPPAAALGPVGGAGAGVAAGGAAVGAAEFAVFDAVASS